MRTLSGICFMVLLVSCATFGGPPMNQDSDLVAPPQTVRTMNVLTENVTVKVYKGNQFPWCRFDVQGIVCDFYYDRLMTDSAISGGWIALTIQGASQLCTSAMFSIGVTPIGVLNASTVTDEHIRACAIGLVQLRMRELAPRRDDPK